MSVSARVALTVTLVLAAGIAVLSAAAYWRVAERLDADLDRALLREAEAYSAAIAQSERDEEPGDALDATRRYLQARSQSFSTAHPVLLVRFSDGKVLSNTDLPLEAADGNAVALDAARARRAFVDLRYRGVEYRAATVPVRATGDTVIAVFQAALPVAGTRALGAQLLWTLLGVGGIVVAIGALIAVWASREALGPLVRTAATAARVTKSSLTERVAYDGPNDEVGHMVAAMNDMLDRLETAFGEQRRFVADASHELRTPLAVISGHLELMRDTEMDERERSDEMALIADEVARMGRLVDDLLALARLEAGGPTAHQPLEVASMLEEAAARGRGLGHRRIVVDATPDLWVSGDPDQITQALLNLVSNAVAHTADGGTIRLHARIDGPRVRIQVEDNGSGIRADDLQRIFDRFYRAQGPRSGDGGGSGLGLAITRRLVELHEGTIAAANLSGGGAVFTVTLPAAPVPDER